MSWLTNIPPKIRALVNKPEIPENLWAQCPACEQMIFHRELELTLNVCPHCGHHMRLDAKRRIESTLDADSWAMIELEPSVVDPLRFRDRKRYSDRLRDSRSSTGSGDAIAVAVGTLGGNPAVAAAFDFQFMGGSMGIAVGNGLIAAAERAVAKHAALIVFPSSGGARMQEGILSLMQMPRTTIAVERVKEAGLPYIVVLTDPTTGGVSASFAMLGDVALAEPGATIGFAGRRVIEETIRETLPEGFQRAEYLLEHGVVDMVVPRQDLRDTLVEMIDLLMNKRVDEKAAIAIENDSDAATAADQPDAAAEPPADDTPSAHAPVEDAPGAAVGE